MELAALPPLKPKVVLGIAAHPDDLDVTAAGTMAAFAGQGADVHYLILTDGSKGTDNPNLTSADLVKLREQEQRAAVAALGGKDVHFLGYPDAELEVTMQLKREIVHIIRTICPDVVITLDPSVLYSAGRGYINHPDHRAAGQAALDAVFPLARDHLTFPELAADGCKPHKTQTILLTNFEQHNFVVDITETFDKKMDAIKAHASQFNDPEGMRGWLEPLAEKLGAEAGYRYGEGFVRIDIR